MTIYLKLVCTNLKYRVLRNITAAIFLSNDHSLYAPIAQFHKYGSARSTWKAKKHKMKNSCGSSCMCKGYFKRRDFIKTRVAQSIYCITRLQITRLFARLPLRAIIFHFVFFFCFPHAPGRSTEPLQMKSSMTFMHREKDHLKAKWHWFLFLVHGSLNQCALFLN